MAKVFITGSADGLGMMSAQSLVEQGHEVVLHARNALRAKEALRKVPGAAGVLKGDLSSMDETVVLAEEVNKLGRFDAVIHNAGVYQVTSKEIFYINTVAPYILTCMITRPKRIVYLSSGMHKQGKPKLDCFGEKLDKITYSDSKLHVVMLTNAVSRYWKDVYSNSVNPGWVPTKMGGKGAPDDLQKGYETQTWLAVSEDKEATVSGHYFFHKQQQPSNKLAHDTSTQDLMLEQLEKLTTITFSK